MSNESHKKREFEGLSRTTKTRLTFGALVLITLFFVGVVAPNMPSGTPGSAFFNQFFPHLGLDLQGGTHLVYEADLREIDDSEKDSALEGARDVIERRVNTLGVAEPLVQTSKKGGNYRIVVELAGVQDVNEAIDLIGETPLLEFKELGDKLSDSEETTTSGEITSVEQNNRDNEQLAEELISQLNDGADFAELAKEYSDDTANSQKGGDLGYVTRGTFTAAFDTSIFDDLQVGEITQNPVKTEFGYHIIKKTGERTNDEGNLEVESSHILLRNETLNPGDEVNWVNTELSGKHVKRAQVVFDGTGISPQVGLTFNSEGSGLFKDITERNLNKPVGIFLDGSVISAPIVQTVISGGEAVITGNFTLDEAKTLVQRLNAGALPVPVDLISQQTIGASLGTDSLQKSLYAAFIGIILVVAFMILFYRLPGILSVLALAVYSVITIALFEMIPVTITLAGIAGFILSIGMAVDANVLIFERIKEELKDGESFENAIETGFTRAWSSIRDSNISSLITTFILYFFGSSIIRGFAVTLGIGILMSMFSAITVTRTFLRLLVKFKFSQRKFLFGVRK